jgi:hypothetical protein
MLAFARPDLKVFKDFKVLKAGHAKAFFRLYSFSCGWPSGYTPGEG